MLFHVLGPLELNGPDGQPIGITAEKQQRLLLALLLRSNIWIPIDSLVEAVWPASPPASAAGNLKTYVHHLRQVIPPHPDGKVRIDSRPGYYRLAVKRTECDVTVFEDLAERAAASPATAVTDYRKALALWRGRPFDPLDSDAVRVESSRLRELRWAARDGLADALLATGNAADVITLLAPLAAADPLREATWQRLLTAYHRAGRRSDGLVAYQRARRHLVSELGVEPSAELQRLQQLLLDDTTTTTAPADRDRGTEDQAQGNAPEIERKDPDDSREIEPDSGTGRQVAPEPSIDAAAGPSRPQVVGAAVARAVGVGPVAPPAKRPQAAGTGPSAPRPAEPRTAGPRQAPPPPLRAARAAMTRWRGRLGRHTTFSAVTATLLVLAAVAVGMSDPPLGTAPHHTPRAAPSGTPTSTPTAAPSASLTQAAPGGSVAGQPNAPAQDEPAKAAPPRSDRQIAPQAPTGPPQLRFLAPARGAVVSGRIVIRVQVTNPAQLKQVDFHYLTWRCGDDGYKKFIGPDKTPGPGGVYEISFDTRLADDGCLHFGAVGLDRTDEDVLYPPDGTYLKVVVSN